jgi:hypothetical protein
MNGIIMNYVQVHFLGAIYRIFFIFAIRMFLEGEGRREDFWRLVIEERACNLSNGIFLEERALCCHI